MPKLAVLVRRIALAVTWLVSMGGLVFTLGYAFEDPGGASAVGLAIAAIGVLAVLTVVAVRAPDLAFAALLVGVVIVGVWGLVDTFTRTVEAPVQPVVTLVLAGPVATLGQRQPVRAGWLLTGLAAGSVAVLVTRAVTAATTAGAAPASLSDLLSTSTGIVVVPLLVLAAVFLMAGLFAAPGERSAGHSGASIRGR